jgi:hypothetical protein
MGTNNNHLIAKWTMENKMKLNGIGKLSLASILVTTALAANAGVSVENEQGKFSISGDVEFDNNVLDTTRETDATSHTVFDQTGRLLLNVAGERMGANDTYIKAQTQPMMHLDGSVDVDDAWIAFGQSADWELKAGRFEGYDLFPVGQDTMLGKVNGDDGVEEYRTNAARGRGANGQLAFSKTADNVYFELATKYGAAPADGVDENAIFVRPVVAVKASDAVTIAAGLETNLTADSADADNDFLGYGATLKYAVDDVAVNLNYAHKDYDTNDQQNNTVGFNVYFTGVQLGYIYADNTDSSDVKTKVNTGYASYKISNVLDVEDMAVYLGTYYSKETDSDAKDFGGRVRIKYLF